MVIQHVHLLVSGNYDDEASLLPPLNPINIIETPVLAPPVVPLQLPVEPFEPIESHDPLPQSPVPLESSSVFSRGSSSRDLEHAFEGFMEFCRVDAHHPARARLHAAFVHSLAFKQSGTLPKGKWQYYCGREWIDLEGGDLVEDRYLVCM